MNKLRFIVLLSTICFTLNAQTASLDDFYEKYKHRTELVNVSVPGFLIQFAASVAQIEAEDEMGRLSMELLKDVKKLKVLTGEKRRVKYSHIITLFDDLAKEGFEELMSVRSEDTDFRFLIRERKNWIRNVVILAEEEEDFTLLSLKTKMHLDDLSAVINESMQN
ncbi:MAG: DUF4252 domain-containing protein [Bacteroidota bacterium]